MLCCAACPEEVDNAFRLRNIKKLTGNDQDAMQDDGRPARLTRASTSWSPARGQPKQAANSTPTKSPPPSAFSASMPDELLALAANAQLLRPEIPKQQVTRMRKDAKFRICSAFQPSMARLLALENVAINPKRTDFTDATREGSGMKRPCRHVFTHSSGLTVAVRLRHAQQCWAVTALRTYTALPARGWPPNPPAAACHAGQRAPGQ